MARDEMKELVSTKSGSKWKRLGAARRAGVLAPLFSIYSRSSIGIGDFEDLKLAVDLCGKMGTSILQLLPMNEIGPTFCPYDSISAFAIEPAYISFGDFSKERTSEIRKVFPAGRAYVDYSVKRRKEGLLWEIYGEKGKGPQTTRFARVRGKQGARVKGERAFDKFIEENSYWLDDFALFKTIKYYQSGKPWYEWEEGYKNKDAAALDAFRKAHGSEILFHKWAQWIAYKQFKAAKSYAADKNILLKGDLPILMSRDSADVWSHTEFFKLGLAAGAPPDMYCAKGQRWGMPTYDWGRIASDGYKYIKEKLKFAENFYDILRIDHVVGLFRIWSIPYPEPAENEGLNGSFDPKEESVWAGHGKKLLAVMNENTSMLLCAEDLGMIPKDCPQALKEFGIPGNEVQRWAKDWATTHDFLEPKEYRTLSVAMLSTHDTTNWDAWWENEAGTVDEAMFAGKCGVRGIDFKLAKASLFDPARERHGRLRWFEKIASVGDLVNILGKRSDEVADFIEIYENTYMEKEKLWKMFGLIGPMREKADPEILAAAFNVTLSSASVFCIELLTDYLNLGGIFKDNPYLYRMNRPGTVNSNNWSMTMPLPLEAIMKHKVCGVIRKMIKKAGRAI